MLESLNTLLAAIPGGEFMWVVVTFLVVFGVLVFFHELGHYLAARSVGVRVETFSIGFGKELYGWNDRHNTRWKLSLIPLGGYVAMHGFQGDDEKPTTDHDAFSNKKVWQRMWVVAAGPLANFLLAIVCFAGLFMAGERIPAAVIGSVAPDQPAAVAGLREGDRVLAVNDQSVTTWAELVDRITAQGEQPLKLAIDRQGENLVMTVTPKVNEVTSILGETIRKPMLGIGVSAEYIRQEHGVLQAVVKGAEQTWNMSVMMLIAIKRMIFGEMAADIGGPILIAQQAGAHAAEGLYELVFFMAFISVNLGLINLFPVPLLDGGHLLYLTAEGIRRKPLPMRLQEFGYKIGGAMLIALMIFAFYKDIVRLITG